MIHAIGMFYRTSLSDGKTLIPVEQEITNIENYIQIQKVRYGDKIDYEIQIDPEIYREWIVKLTLQPLVENAIVHGMRTRSAGGRIRIVTSADGAYCRIQVTDNGGGFTCTGNNPPAATGRRSIGLHNIASRVQLTGGSFRLYSLHGLGTTARLTLPMPKEENRA